MVQGKSILYQLLSLFEELYPGWVINLNKKPEKKKKVCDAYRKCIPIDMTEDHITLLHGYLQSSLNTKYRTWPPPPLELISIFELNKKKAQSNPLPLNLPIVSNTNLEAVDSNSVSFHITSFIINRRSTEILRPDSSDGRIHHYLVPFQRDSRLRIEDMPVFVQPYLIAIQSYKLNPDFMLFLCFNMLYYKLRDFFPQYLISDVVQKMIDPINRAFICQELHIKQLDTDSVLNFFKETRWNEEIFLYLEEQDLINEETGQSEELKN